MGHSGEGELPACILLNDKVTGVLGRGSAVKRTPEKVKYNQAISSPTDKRSSRHWIKGKLMHGIFWKSLSQMVCLRGCLMLWRLVNKITAEIDMRRLSAHELMRANRARGGIREDALTIPMRPR